MTLLRPPRHSFSAALIVLLLPVVPFPVLGFEASDGDLLSLSLEELGSIEVTTLSQRPQRLAQAPASLFVISADDLRRAGVTSLPEALRLAPNLQVARTNSQQYAITARGFNNSTGNKLQVLLDGRILYTPLFSGVFWDTPEVLLEDVERIEVISGSAATLWGANAVNGVINVITRRSEDTRGGLFAAVAGTQERVASLRHGASSGDMSFRLFGKFAQRDDTRNAAGADLDDRWRRSLLGFRADWGSGADGLTLQGSAYHGALDAPQPEDLRIKGANLMLEWNRALSSGDGLHVRAYADRAERRIPASVDDTLDIYDAGIRYVSKRFDNHALVLGGSHRLMHDRAESLGGRLAFLPSHRRLHRTSVFINDEITLGARWRATPGIRVEHNNYTGIEFMPSLRLAWQTPLGGLLWGSLSRAVRTPSRVDRELFAPAQPPFLLAGGPEFESEISIATELGYRAEPTARSSYSITLFHHDYDELRSLETDATGAFVIANRMQGEGVGLEAWGQLQIDARWRLSAGLMLLDQRLRFEPGSTDSQLRIAGNDPSNQWFVACAFDFSSRTSIDARVRHVGELPDPRVPAYTTVDLRFAWRPADGLELSLAGHNLADSGHPEFGAVSVRGEIERSLQLGLRWAF